MSDPIAYSARSDPDTIHMELLRGFKVSKDNYQFCLKIIKNVYGQKQAGRTWSLHLKKGLLSIGFTQRFANNCIFFL